MTNHAVHNVGAAPEIRSSILEIGLSFFADIEGLQVDATSDVEVAHSQIGAGFNVDAGGKLTCHEVYDAAFADLSCAP